MRDQELPRLQHPLNKRRNTLALVLLIVCGLLALISAAQDRVIDRQKALILQLSGDSQELFSIKARQIRQQHVENQSREKAAPSSKPADKHSKVHDGCLLSAVCG